MLVYKVRTQDRVKSAIAVAAIHAALGYALFTGAGTGPAIEAGDPLKIFDVAPKAPPPPSEKAIAAKAPSRAAEGAASPPNLKGRATPIVAPPLPVPVPPPIVTAADPGSGRAAATGAATISGPGTGAGGVGTGTGSGAAGSGAGGGGIALRSRHVGGRIVNADYPRAARRDGAEGTVVVRFTVGVDGFVRGCAVTTSSGNAELDGVTCRLIEARFRYEPARDRAGRPVAEDRGWQQRWWIGG